MADDQPNLIIRIILTIKEHAPAISSMTAVIGILMSSITLTFLVLGYRNTRLQISLANEALIETQRQNRAVRLKQYQETHEKDRAEMPNVELSYKREIDGFTIRFDNYGKGAAKHIQAVSEPDHMTAFDTEVLEADRAKTQHHQFEKAAELPKVDWYWIYESAHGTTVCKHAVVESSGDHWWASTPVSAENYGFLRHIDALEDPPMTLARCVSIMHDRPTDKSSNVLHSED